MRVHLHQFVNNPFLKGDAATHAQLFERARVLSEHPPTAAWTEPRLAHLDQPLARDGLIRRALDFSCQLSLKARGQRHTTRYTLMNVNEEATVWSDDHFISALRAKHIHSFS